MAEKTTKKNRSFYIQWDSTTDCNLHCSHCYHNSEGEEHKTHRQGPNLMSIGQTKEMLDDLEQTCERWDFSPTFNISGGEPLMREDLFDIISYARSKNIRTNLLTNGTLLTSERASRLHDLGISIVQISIDGTKETHNQVRGESWAYDRAVRGIRNCKDYDIHVTVSNTLMKSNVSQIEKIIQEASENGAKGIGFQTLVPSPLLGINDPEFLDCQEMKRTYDTLKEFREKYSEKIDVYKSEVLWHLYNPNLNNEPNFYLGGCSAGFKGLSVLSDGTVYACRRLPIPIGKINEGIIKLVTESPFMQKLRETRKKQTEFCDTAAHCGGCRAVAYATTGDPFAKDPTCFKHLK